MKRSRITLIIIGLVVVGILFVRLNGSNDDGGGSATPSPSASPTVSPNPPDAPDSSEVLSDNDKIVQAAASAANALSSAALLPDTELQRLVKVMVAPAQRDSFILVTRQSAPALIRTTGYATAEQANLYSGYYVDTQQFRVEEVRDNSATVLLYVVTSWRTADDKLYRVPDILSVQLEKHNSRWMYVSSALGPEPQLQPGTTFEQASAQFGPYLEGFTSYDELGSSPS